MKIHNQDLLIDRKLTKSFYNRHVVEVAKDLLGKTLVFGSFRGVITETEAYRGSDDEASHAARGLTPRSSIMFGPPGYSYVYLIYGVYFCLNIVTEELHSPSAVLIRGLKLPDYHLDGPGKICRHLKITKEHHNINLVSDPKFYLIDSGLVSFSYKATPRIGIRKATDKLWRFIIDQEESLTSLIKY